MSTITSVSSTPVHPNSFCEQIDLEQSQSNDQEIRILEFLHKEGIEMQSSFSKMYNYLDIIRNEKKHLEVENSQTNTFKEKGKDFHLNSKLYLKRVSRK